MKRLRKIEAWLLIVVMLVLNVYKYNVYGATNKTYTLLALSKDENAISIVANNGNINGNVATNGNAHIVGANLNGNKYDYVCEGTPILFDAIDEEYFTTEEVFEETKQYDENNNNVNIAQNIYGDAIFRNNVNLNKSIKALNDIKIIAQNVNAGNITLVAETGNVIIESDNISLSGLIYAPYGTVKMIGNNINLNNVCIIANKISISANSVNISSNSNVQKFVTENAQYEDSSEIYALGTIDGNNVKINWYTDSECKNYKIYESVDNENYSLVAEVVDSTEYNYTITRDFEKKYFKVANANYAESIPFVVNRTQEGYVIELLDSDGDVIPDVLEKEFGTDIDNKDTDTDALSDYEEVTITLSNPLVANSISDSVKDAYADSDEDGLDNITELSLGTKPLVYDTDEDGLSDYEEIIIYNTNALVIDTDEDGLNDGSEARLGTEPNVVDTNGNDIKDGDEYYEQLVMEERYETSLLIDNVAKPSLTITAQGDVNSKIEVTEYIGHLKGEEREYVGKTLEIQNSSIKSGVITFTLSEEYKISEYNYGNFSTNGLIICYNDGENTYPLESRFDVTHKTLSAQMCGDGIYFVLNAVEWLESFGIDIEEMIDSSVESTLAPNEKLNLGIAANNIGTYSSEAISLVNAESVAKANVYSEASNSVIITDNEDTSIDIASVKVKGQVDIVFVIDTTGSMSSYISNVKNNIIAFVDELEMANINASFALVEYRDITYDGSNYTNTKYNENNNSNWFNSAEEFKSRINALRIDGGGDTPETAIDALEMARQLDMRKSSQKFFILVTDAGYKVNNNYGINSMDEMIDMLIADSINTSVISSSSYKSAYKNLYEKTGGVFAEVSNNFKDELLGIAKNISTTTNEGYWIALDGLIPQIVRLDEKPTPTGTADTDSDKLLDREELKRTLFLKKFNTRDYFYALGMSTSINGQDIYVYEYYSNPTLEDTDDDGLLDGSGIYVNGVKAAPKDAEPLKVNGAKNIWKKHIFEMEKGEKLSTGYSNDYFETVEYEAKIQYIPGLMPYLDNNLVEVFSSWLVSRWGSKFLDFKYDDRHIALHSDTTQWQSVGGYNDFYDWIFDAATEMDKLKLDFSSNGKNYVVWAWKGNYLNLGPGSEVGFYTQNELLEKVEKFTGLEQWMVSNEFPMTCSLYRIVGNGVYTNYYNWYPELEQWWITGFVPNIYDFHSVTDEELIQVASVDFSKNPKMLEDLQADEGDEDDAEYLIFDMEDNILWLAW